MHIIRILKVAHMDVSETCFHPQVWLQRLGLQWKTSQAWHRFQRPHHLYRYRERENVSQVAVDWANTSRQKTSNWTKLFFFILFLAELIADFFGKRCWWGRKACCHLRHLHSPEAVGTLSSSWGSETALMVSSTILLDGLVSYGCICHGFAILEMSSVKYSDEIQFGAAIGLKLNLTTFFIYQKRRLFAYAYAHFDWAWRTAWHVWSNDQIFHVDVNPCFFLKWMILRHVWWCCPAWDFRYVQFY